MTAVLVLSVAYPLLAVLAVVVADAWEAHQFRGRFDCGCPWPPEEDGPQVVTCPHGSWQFRVWHDWLGRQRDAWDETEPSEGES